MPRHPITGTICILIVSTLSPSSMPAARGQEADDEVMKAHRRQVEAKRKQKDEMFARLRAIPEAPRPIPVVPGRIVGRGFLLEPIPVEDEDEPDEPEVGPDAEVPPVRIRALAAANFDIYLLNDGFSPESRRQHLERVLAARMKTAGERHPFNDAELAKLRLAGRGDIKRFFDAIEEKRRQFDSVRDDLEKGQRFLLQSRGDFVVDLNAFFGAGSIFSKTLNKVLDERAKSSRPSD